MPGYHGCVDAHFQHRHVLHPGAGTVIVHIYIIYVLLRIHSPRRRNGYKPACAVIAVQTEALGLPPLFHLRHHAAQRYKSTHIGGVAHHSHNHLAACRGVVSAHPERQFQTVHIGCQQRQHQIAFSTRMRTQHQIRPVAVIHRLIRSLKAAPPYAYRFPAGWYRIHFRSQILKSIGKRHRKRCTMRSCALYCGIFLSGTERGNAESVLRVWLQSTKHIRHLGGQAVVGPGRVARSPVLHMPHGSTDAGSPRQHYSVAPHRVHHHHRGSAIPILRACVHTQTHIHTYVEAVARTRRQRLDVYRRKEIFHITCLVLRHMCPEIRDDIFMPGRIVVHCYQQVVLSVILEGSVKLKVIPARNTVQRTGVYFHKSVGVEVHKSPVQSFFHCVGQVDGDVGLRIGLICSRIIEFYPPDPSRAHHLLGRDDLLAVRISRNQKDRQPVGQFRASLPYYYGVRRRGVNRQAGRHVGYHLHTVPLPIVSVYTFTAHPHLVSGIGAEACKGARVGRAGACHLNAVQSLIDSLQSESGGHTPVGWSHIPRHVDRAAPHIVDPEIIHRGAKGPCGTSCIECKIASPLLVVGKMHRHGSGIGGDEGYTVVLRGIPEQ